MPEARYSEKDEIIREYLATKGYSVKEAAGSPDRETFTYQCENEGMPFWVKVAMGSGDVSEKRVRLLKNEVASIIALWQTYPDGETGGFNLPPGPEDVFEEDFNGNTLYGYSRFMVEGEILGTALREGTQEFSEWAEKYVEIIKTVDTLPDLNLPRTVEKKETDFSKIVLDTADRAAKQLEGLVDDAMKECIDKAVEDVKSYVGRNTLITGSVHGDIIPDHLVFLNIGVKPTLVNFTKLCQWYPRFYDAAMLYAWVHIVLQDEDGARLFLDRIMETGMDKKQLDQMKTLINALLVNTLSVYLIGEGRGKQSPISCGVFMKMD